MFFSTFEKRGREWVKIEILCHFSISVLIMNSLVWIIKTNCLVTIHGNLYVIFIDLEPLSFLHISKILKHCGLNEWQHSFFFGAVLHKRSFIFTPPFGFLRPNFG